MTNSFRWLPRLQFLPHDCDRERSESLVVRESTADVLANTAIPLLTTKDGLVLSAQSQPQFIEWALEKLGLKDGESIIEVGSGSGWLSCSLAACMPRSQIFGIEIHAPLVEISEVCRQRLGLSNVHFYHHDATTEPPIQDGFTKLISTSALQRVPRWFVERASPACRYFLACEVLGGGEFSGVFYRRDAELVSADKLRPSFSVPFQKVSESTIGYRQVYPSRMAMPGAPRQLRTWEHPLQLASPFADTLAFRASIQSAGGSDLEWHLGYRDPRLGKVFFSYRIGCLNVVICEFGVLWFGDDHFSAAVLEAELSELTSTSDPGAVDCTLRSGDEEDCLLPSWKVAFRSS